jgi:toxin ParE1/3/4
MKRYAIDRHPLVRRDFFDIARLIGEYAGYPIADLKTLEIESTISSLRQFPHIGAPRDDVFPGLRAVPTAEKAVVCFTVNDQSHIVKIVCVTYAGQDWQTIARDRRDD